MNKLTMSFALVALLVPGLAAAADYGVAGCGLGSILFDPDDSQTSAATSNGSSGSQTFGITSGTSNCVDGSGAASMDQEIFLRTNYASIAQDAAMGGGEYLVSFAQILGCEAEVQPAFFELTQKNHHSLFATEHKPGEVLVEMKQQMRQDAALKASCARI